MSLLEHRSPLCGCVSEFDYKTVQTYRAFRPCAMHADRSGRSGYIVAQAQMFALSFAAQHLEEQGVTDAAWAYRDGRLVFRVAAEDLESLRASLTEAQAGRDYRVPHIAAADREAFHSAVMATLYDCTLEAL